MPKIKVNGIDLYYDSVGTGEPIVFISGFTADHTVWRSVQSILAKNYRVITFDNRGVGQTDCPDEPYTVDLMANDAVALCNALKIKKAHFVGSSMGGRIAQSIALNHPDLAQTITLANSMSFIHPLWRIVAEGLLELYQTNAPVETRTKLVVPWVFSRQFLDQPNAIEGCILINKENPYPITETGYRCQYAAMIAFDSRKELHKINTPTLVFYGDEDIIAPLYQSNELIEKIPNAEAYCFKGVAHLPHIEKPMVFVNELTKFLIKHSIEGN